MKKSLLKSNVLKTVISLFLLLSFSANGQTPYWKDTQVTEVGKEYPRTEFTSFSTREAAIKGSYESSPYYRSLNGTWKFLYTDAYYKLPEGIEKPDYDTFSWNDILVPGNWERQGFGVAIYVNSSYEFNSQNPIPPILPEDNPAGVYRRNIEIPAEWLSRDIFLNIDGAKSGVYVYINGKEVGYSEDSKDRAQFQINKYVTEGNNVLTLKILRWSTGSWLECQDFWRISGIERDVYLTSQPKEALKDFKVLSTLDSTFSTGIFKLDIITNNKNQKAINVSYELIDANGKIVSNKTKKVDRGIAPGEPWVEEDYVSFKAEIPEVKTWSAEEPNLYTLIIAVESNGKTEYTPYKVGFRKLEIRGSLFLVNGQPVKFKGVNMHEHDQTTGHYVSKELISKDLNLMRQNNINAIRTSHYPQSRYFYELCDEIGIYVYSEANIESHGMGYKLSKGGTLGNNREFLAAHIDRIKNMYERCKNFPSVTIFSLGNEAGNGYNFYKAYEWIEEREKGENKMNRPICYERAILEWNTDIYVPQYPSADWFKKIGEQGCDRPVIPSEYSHAMGNSNGGLWKQWENIYKYPHLQGAFIWDWVDQGFLEQDKNGTHYWAYGGDYGKNSPSDNNFCCNGLVSPDRTPHPALEEVKYAYSNIGFKMTEAPEQDLNKKTNTDSLQFEIINRFYFISLSKYTINYSIEKDGISIKKGTLHFDTPAQSSEKFRISLKGIKFKEESNYYMNFSVVTKKEERLIPAGFEVAAEQFLISGKKTTSIQKRDLPFPLKNGSKLTIDESEKQITVTSNKLIFTFDKEERIVTSYRVKGKEFLTEMSDIRPNFWRAPTDNDYGNGAPDRMMIWKDASSKFKTVVNAVMAEESALITVKYSLPAGNYFRVTYKIDTDATLHVETSYSAAPDGTPELPRIGVRFRLPVQMNSFSYFGRGPQENYCDRKTSAKVGLYKSSADTEYFPYIRPQENGHHCDVTILSFNNFVIKADDFMEINVLRNSVEDFDRGKQTHINDITKRNYVEVCLDYREVGVGGYDSWGSRPDAEATIPATHDYKWGFTIYYETN